MVKGSLYELDLDLPPFCCHRLAIEESRWRLCRRMNDLSDSRTSPPGLGGTEGGPCAGLRRTRHTVRLPRSRCHQPGYDRVEPAKTAPHWTEKPGKPYIVLRIRRLPEV